MLFFDTLGKEKKQEKLNRFVFLYCDKIGFLRLCFLGSFPSNWLNTGYDTCAVLVFAGYQNMEGAIKQGKTFFHLNELHNYEIGDEFHSVSELNSQHFYHNIKTINTCLNKQEINDTLVFTFKERKHIFIIDRQEVIAKLIDTVEDREHQVKRPVYNANPFNKSSYLTLLKTIYTSKEKGELDGYYWEASNSMYSVGDSCFRMGFTNYEIVEYKYKGAFGMDIPNTLSNAYLYIVYYKKGSKTWGTPLPLNIGLNKITNIKTVSANPANKIAIIDLAHMQKINIHNALGKKVDASTTLNQHAVEVNAEALINGIYYIKLITENNTSRCTLVIKH